MQEWYVLGVGKGTLFREVSSFQRLKCMQEWYVLGVGKGTLFREVSSFQRLKCMQGWYVLGVGKGTLFREVSSVQVFCYTEVVSVRMCSVDEEGVLGLCTSLGRGRSY